MINIAEKLKDAPTGFKLYSPICGECYLDRINHYNTIFIKYAQKFINFNEYGQNTPNGECLLFPSKEIRGWDNFCIEEPWKKYKFKPFDRVIVRDYDNQRWKADLFSHIVPSDEYNKEIYMCVSTGWKQCLPYNEETAKLIGTTDDYE